MRAFKIIGSFLVAATITAPALRGQEAPASPLPPFEQSAFEAACVGAGAGDERMAEFRAEIEELGIGLAADHLMRDIHPAYGAAVDLSEAGDPKAALQLTKVLSSTSDKVLQGFARYHLARVFLDGDDPEGAVRVLDDFLQENGGLTPLDAEAVYFYASALAEIPAVQSAMEIFNAYLQWFPDAPERFRATAHQRLQELLLQKDDQLHALADDMKWCERRIRNLDTGEEVQEKQRATIDLLDQLIEEMEEREKQASGPPSGNGPPSGPANQSALPGGEHRIGNLNDAPNVADRWGNLKDADRKAIEAEIQNSLPAHYRKPTEEFYKKLGSSRGGSGR